MRPRAALLAFALFSLVRAVLLPAFELMPQSAYYATAYAEHPALSYYDHPPLIGWLLWLGTALLGSTTLGVRATVFVATLGTQVALYALALRFLDRAGAGRALALATSGGVAVLMSFLAVPDVPLLLCWALALLALERALFGRNPSPGDPRALSGTRAGTGAGTSAATGAAEGSEVVPRRWRGTAWWAAAGVAMGLAFLGKYTGVFLQGGLVLFLLASREHRRRLRTPGPWICLLLAQAVSLPVYVWNARHGWASFAYQSAGRAEEARGFDPDFFFGFLGSQVVVLLPVAFFAFLAAVGRQGWRAVRRLGPPEAGEPGERSLFLLCFAVPVFATCVVLSPVTWVKTNWALPAYLSGLILAAGAIGHRWVRWHLVTGVLLHLALVIQVLWYPVPIESDDTWFGWNRLAEAVETRLAEHPDAFVFSADHYKTTAELRFYGDVPAYGMNVLGWNALHYDFLGEDLHALVGRDALFLRNEADLEPGPPSGQTERYLERVRRHFREVRELEPVEIRRRGEVVRRFRVFLCRDYLGPEPAGADGPIGR